MAGSEAISPTAHYTGYVWARNGLAPPEFETIEGRILFESLRPLMAANGVLGRGTLEAYLLARHGAIDALLERAIEQDGVTQVIEVASGMSPRGWRFTQRYGNRLVYVEADLPGMARRKRGALERMGSLDRHHRVADLDALRSRGRQSIGAVAADLDPGHGLAIITEGLLGYLSAEHVRAIWRRFARVLSRFTTGRYISDVHLASVQTIEVRAFRLALSAFVRGRVHMHFDRPEDVVAALRAAGFGAAEVHRAVDLAGPDRDAPSPDPASTRSPDPASTRSPEPASTRSPDPASGLSHILEASTK